MAAAQYAAQRAVAAAERPEGQVLALGQRAKPSDAESNASDAPAKANIKQLVSVKMGVRFVRNVNAQRNKSQLEETEVGVLGVGDCIGEVRRPSQAEASHA